MRDGVKMLITHINSNDKTLLIVDSDCDGYCSSAVLLNYLNRHFPAWVQNQITYFMHTGKQHGLGDMEVASLVEQEYKLIICPDSASNDYDQHKALKEQGIDVLVLDHHEAEKVSEYACIINNQLCDYPTKSLCGAAIVYKFCKYIDKLMGTDFVRDYEDLTALALIGDMMDMKDFETHYLTKIGLQNIHNPFFVEMVNRQHYKLENNLTPFGIAFYVVPYINAITRSGTIEEKYLTFEAMLEWLAEKMIPSTKRGYKGTFETRKEQAGRTCMNVKNRQKKKQDASLENIEEIIFELNLLDNKILVVPTEQESVDKNLAGLIANQLASKYARPTLVLRKIEHQEAINDPEGQPLIMTYYTYEGSGRNYGKSRLENFSQFCLDTELVMYAEGHASAFGIGIAEDELPRFIQLTNELLKDFDNTPCYYVDLEVEADQLSDNEVFSIGSNTDIWAQGLEEPLIAITNIKLSADDIHYLGERQNTLKLTFEGRKTTMIKFNVKEEEKAMLDPGDGTITITAIGKCNLNYYMGSVTPQVLLEDFEIVKQTKWDF
jgi:single-stranded-DNA-specific exonuclease